MKKFENGRSMVEMLGVLAIIGILSVTGIYGYALAMRKHRANEIANTASMLAILASSMDQGEGGCIDLSSSNLPNPLGTGMKMVAEKNGNSTEVCIQLEDSEICEFISNTNMLSFICGTSSCECSE